MTPFRLPDRWIGVTGMIRSGTTFLGKVLSLPLDVAYLHEPFNGGISRSNRRPFIPRYVRPEAADASTRSYHRHLADIFQLNLHLPTTRHPRDSVSRRVVKTLVGSRGPLFLRFARLNPLNRVGILKDPTCKLTMEYLYRAFDVRPVIVVRHPASLAASLKRVGWWPEMHDFREQTALVEDYFADERDFLKREWPSPLHEAMAHWRATHKVLLHQAQQTDDWIVVTHEELSARPLSTFRQLYETLGLTWSRRIERRIRFLTQGSNAVEASGNQAMDLQRDSASLFEHRRDSLSATERREIFEIVADVALQLYSAESFAVDESNQLFAPTGPPFLKE
jgi:hypothetical protein